MKAVTWVDPDGVEYPLSTEESRLVLPGLLGHRAPPALLREEEVPLQDGAVVRSVRAGVREVSVPLLVWADEPELLDDHMADLASALDPARGQGHLNVERDDSSNRVLFCRYAGGLEGSEAEPGHDTAVLVFRAHDPFWQDPADTTRVITQVAGGTFFPFFPILLTASELFADEVIDNTGDVEAWPVWEITGPGSDPVLRNLTTGKLARLDGVMLGAGDVVRIDTRPGRKLATLNGASVFGALSADSSLWALARGPQTVRVELSAATGATTVELTYRRRFRGA